MAADLFSAKAQPAEPRKAPSLHSDTEIYLAVDKLGAYLWRAAAHIQRGLKGLFAEMLLYEAAEMAELVRRAAIARGADKLPMLDDVLGRLERVKFLLRAANAAEVLPHRTYASSIEITESIGRQASGLKKHFHAPASSPAT